MRSFRRPSAPGGTPCARTAAVQGSESHDGGPDAAPSACDDRTPLLVSPAPSRNYVARSDGVDEAIPLKKSFCEPDNCGSHITSWQRVLLQLLRVIGLRAVITAAAGNL